MRFDFWRREQLMCIPSEPLVFLCYSASADLCITLWALDFSVAAEVSAASTQRIWGMSISQKSGQILSWLVIFLAVSAGYLYAFPQPNIFYAVIVALHAAGRRAGNHPDNFDAVSIAPQRERGG